jgi:hypothetical protein
VVRFTGINLPAWTGEGWYFNPLAWQFLFMIGAILAYAPPAMPQRRWPIDLLAVLVLLAGIIVIWVIDIHPAILARMPASVIRFIITEDKTGLHPFRLLSILSLAWLVVRLVPPSANWLHSRVAAPLVLMGQNSLPVFCFGIFFGFIARLGLEADDRLPMQVAVNLLGALAMVAVGGLAAWYRGKRPAASVQPSNALPAVARTDTG